MAAEAATLPEIGENLLIATAPGRIFGAVTPLAGVFFVPAASKPGSLPFPAHDSSAK